MTKIKATTNKSRKKIKHILDAHGGLAHWQTIEYIDLDMSVSGLLFKMKRQAPVNHGRFRIYTERPEVIFFDFPIVGQQTVFYGEERVEIQDVSGHILNIRKYPRKAFNKLQRLFRWDSLDFMYFSGYALWNYISMPFLLLNDGVKVEDRTKQELNDWDQLSVTFPNNFPTHCKQQLFYFDAEGKLQRHDYTAEVVASWAKAAHFSECYKSFSGLALPTKRRVHPLLPFDVVFTSVVLVAIEIHHADITYKER